MAPDLARELPELSQAIAFRNKCALRLFTPRVRATNRAEYSAIWSR
jgi:hypothetical protein